MILLNLLPYPTTLLFFEAKGQPNTYAKSKEAPRH